MADSIRLTLDVQAPVAEAYRAFTNPIALREWLSDGAEADAKPGGRLFLWWNDGFRAAGEFTALDKDKSASFSWLGRGEPAESEVHVQFSAKGDGTSIALEHTLPGPVEAWEKEHHEIENGWKESFEVLKVMLEDGQDIRLTRRPMLGIMVGSLDADRVAKLGVPVTEGIVLDNTLEGMGAAGAGLQKDDVLVGMGDKVLTGGGDIPSALKGKHAGDVVKVVFYRGKDKKTVDMTLSGRPNPEVPKDPKVLAAKVREMYDEQLKGLNEVLEGVTEAEAHHHPAPGEWNVIEVIGHLVHGEVGNHSFIASLLSDAELIGFFLNVEPHTRGFAAANPTLADARDAFSKALIETVAILEALPPDFVAHRGTYWRAGYGLLTGSILHPQDHFQQIKDFIASARK
jgi:uncharacterized protein YndB with AHSA1/START domain